MEFNGSEGLEELQAPKISYARTGTTATRVFLINTASEDALIGELLVNPSSGANNLASLPGKQWLRAERVETEAFDDGLLPGAGENPAASRKRRVTVYYSADAGDAAGGNPREPGSQNPGNGSGPGGDAGATGGESVEFFRHHGSIGAEFVTLADYAVRWTDRPNEAVRGANAGLLLLHIEHRLTFAKVSSPPWSAIRGSVGKVNENGWAGAAQKRVLFNGCDWDETRDERGRPIYDLEYRFSEKTRPWDHFINPATGKFEQLERKNGDPIYEGVEFGPLFQNLYS